MLYLPGLRTTPLKLPLKSPKRAYGATFSTLGCSVTGPVRPSHTLFTWPIVLAQILTRTASFSHKYGKQSNAPGMSSLVTAFTNINSIT
jgi:hypothetical protein